MRWDRLFTIPLLLGLIYQKAAAGSDVGGKCGTSPGFHFHPSEAGYRQCCRTTTCDAGTEPVVCDKWNGNASCKTCPVGYVQPDTVASYRRVQCNFDLSCLGEGRLQRDGLCVCDVDLGYYEHTDPWGTTSCKQTNCSAGQESTSDGTCVDCHDGFFKPNSGYLPCQPWSQQEDVCTRQGGTFLRGSKVNDSQCLNNKDTPETPAIQVTTTAEGFVTNSSPVLDSSRSFDDGSKFSYIYVIVICCSVIVVLALSVLLVFVVYKCQVKNQQSQTQNDREKLSLQESPSSTGTIKGHFVSVTPQTWQQTEDSQANTPLISKVENGPGRARGHDSKSRMTNQHQGVAVDDCDYDRCNSDNNYANPPQTAQERVEEHTTRQTDDKASAITTISIKADIVTICNCEKTGNCREPKVGEPPEARQEPTTVGLPENWLLDTSRSGAMSQNTQPSSSVSRAGSVPGGIRSESSLNYTVDSKPTPETQPWGNTEKCIPEKNKIAASDQVGCVESEQLDCDGDETSVKQSL